MARVALYGPCGVHVKQYLETFLEILILFLNQLTEIFTLAHQMDTFHELWEATWSVWYSRLPKLRKFHRMLWGSDSMLRIFSLRRLHWGLDGPSYAIRLMWWGVAPHLALIMGFSILGHSLNPLHHLWSVTWLVWCANKVCLSFTPRLTFKIWGQVLSPLRLYGLCDLTLAVWSLLR